jgi:hypothetical protein
MTFEYIQAMELALLVVKVLAKEISALWELKNKIIMALNKPIKQSLLKTYSIKCQSLLNILDTMQELINLNLSIMTKLIKIL